MTLQCKETKNRLKKANMRAKSSAVITSHWISAGLLTLHAIGIPFSLSMSTRTWQLMNYKFTCRLTPLVHIFQQWWLWQYYLPHWKKEWAKPVSANWLHKNTDAFLKAYQQWYPNSWISSQPEDSEDLW